MIKINFKVTQESVIKTAQQEIATTGNVNNILCEFELANEFKELTCIAVFNDVAMPLSNGVCYAPAELKQGKCTVGVFGYSLVANKVNKRISPAPVVIYINKGSYQDIVEAEVPTPSQFEQYVNTIQELVNSGLLKGEKGDKGDKGEKGDKGDKGEDGSGSSDYKLLENIPRTLLEKTGKVNYLTLEDGVYDIATDFTLVGDESINQSLQVHAGDILAIRNRDYNNKATIALYCALGLFAFDTHYTDDILGSLVPLDNWSINGKCANAYEFMTVILSLAESLKQFQQMLLGFDEELKKKANDKDVVKQIKINGEIKTQENNEIDLGAIAGGTFNPTPLPRADESTEIDVATLNNNQWYICTEDVEFTSKHQEESFVDSVENSLICCSAGFFFCINGYGTWCAEISNSRRDWGMCYAYNEYDVKNLLGYNIIEFSKHNSKNTRLQIETLDDGLYICKGTGWIGCANNNAKYYLSKLTLPIIQVKGADVTIIAGQVYKINKSNPTAYEWTDCATTTILDVQEMIDVAFVPAIEAIVGEE